MQLTELLQLFSFTQTAHIAVSQEIIVGGLLRFCHKLVEKTVLGA
jgi:hypothetical protein